MKGAYMESAAINASTILVFKVVMALSMITPRLSHSFKRAVLFLSFLIQWFGFLSVEKSYSSSCLSTIAGGTITSL